MADKKEKPEKDIEKPEEKAEQKKPVDEKAAQNKPGKKAKKEKKGKEQKGKKEAGGRPKRKLDLRAILGKVKIPFLRKKEKPEKDAEKEEKPAEKEQTAEDAARDQEKPDEKDSKDKKEKDGKEADNPAKRKLDPSAILSKAKMPLLVIIVAVAALVGGLSFAGFVNTRSKASAKTEAKKVARKAEAKPKPTTFFSMGDITVNLLGGQTYLQTSISLELEKDKKIKAEIKEKKPQIQDAIITILSTFTSEELLTQDGKNRLKGEIKNKVDSLLSCGKIKGVYFTTFIMQ